MSVQMTFYPYFTKRINSTKQPEGGVEYSVAFKDSFSILGGVVKLQVDFDTARSFTAAKYETYYYNISDILSVTNNIVEVTLVLDVLATYKLNIAGYNSLIERCPIDSEMKFIPDNTIFSTGKVTSLRMLMNKNILYESNKPENPAVQIKSNNNASVQCFYTTVEGLIQLCSKLDSILSTQDITLLTEVNFSNLSLYDIENATGAVLGNDIIIGNHSYTLTHPVISFKSPSVLAPTPVVLKLQEGISYEYNDARKIDSNYTKISFVLNGTEIFLDSYLNNAENIEFNITVDIITLSVLTRVYVQYNGTSRLIYTANTNIGVPYIVSNNNSFELRALSVGFRLMNTLAFGGINMAKGNIANTAINAASNIAGSLYSLGQTIPAYCSGSAPGTMLSLADLDVRVYLYEFGSTDKNDMENGYPYYKVNSINSIGTTGFFKFVSPDIDVNVISVIKSSINEFLQNGFFYE